MVDVNMEKFVRTDEQQVVNLPSGQTLVFIGKIDPPRMLNVPTNFWDKATIIKWKSYQIKESDFRTKTATLVTPQHVDLSQGQFAILISSPFHENFSGILLSADYNEDKRLYTYKCQDWSRKLQSKIDTVLTGDTTTYNLLRHLMTHGGCKFPNPTQKQLNAWTRTLSGLRSADTYQDNKWGGPTNINPMTQKPKWIIRNVSHIEAIRDICLAYNIDVYFNDCGVLQIEPYFTNDFKNTGLKLQRYETSNRDYKFDVTNVVTGVVIENDDKKKAGNYSENSTLINLFGLYYAEIGALNPGKTTNKTSTTTTATNTNGNPYNSKAKKIWINSDNGSCDMKNSIASLLRSNGWTVHNGGCCSNCHYQDYYNVSSDYSVYATLYNGFCAGTVREAYSSSIQNTLKKKGVQLVIMWDTRDWTNPQGMKPYRYGDFSGYNAGRAWDDNFSSSDPSIKNVSSWLKSNNAKYCASPTADGIVQQFLAGGYFKYASK